ncbi:hypothetical protein [Fodinibius saliphilus]|uniref:hypothetical protein n=1 Tax=Fodinibius saliphilus TaxID=1920650 RepID=UPI001107E03B|nr:hypothetical protein [Fodinibius saliphilus]
MNARNILLQNAKNLLGWRTDRKIVVFAVDDYGNVRLHSKEARQKLDMAGLPTYNRFDAFDSLETKQDLAILYETLSSVNDKNGRNAVFTAYTVPCNINFEKIAETNYEEYHYEVISETYQKLATSDASAYKGGWELWKEGIEKGLMVPQFHGREHLNVNLFNEKLEAEDHDLMTCLKNRSFTSIKSNEDKLISPMAAFDFWQFKENEHFHGILEDGLIQFENVFGTRAQNFTPPVYSAHPVLHKTLKKHGIRFVDMAMISSVHQGQGKFDKKFNYTGKKNDEGLCLIVRNVVFEPSANYDIDWPSYVMQQIEAAFRWNRPAVISSHRVNFCGHINEDNRKKGVKALHELLKRITDRWPEVEFMAANELGELIVSE